MGKKEKRHKHSHTSKKNKLCSQDSDRVYRPRPKARPDSSNSFSTSDTSVHLAMIMSNLDIVSGMALSILDLTLVLLEVILGKISEERDYNGL